MGDFTQTSCNSFKMPYFDPKKTSFKQFIDDVYEVKAWGLGWDAANKLRGLAMILPTGWCTRAFQDLTDAQKKDYATLKENLIVKIDRSDECRQSAQTEFTRMLQKQTETVDDFAHRLQVKADVAYASFAKTNREELCAQRFIEGLSSTKVKDQIHVLNSQSSKGMKFSTLVDTARRLAYSLPDHKDQSQHESVFRVKCFYCKKPGHKISDCRKKKADDAKKRDQPASGPSPDRKKHMKCYKCHAKGHLAKECVTVNNIHEEKSLDVPTVEIQLGSGLLNAVVDSGASVSCISTAMLQKCFDNSVLLHPSDAVLRGPTGEILECAGTLCTSLVMNDQNMK